jgi:light-regulated signal transduction histidine kinase (bacteriophytochrome)
MNQRSDAPASHQEALEQRALEECNNEPIETPGFIQEGGALLACAFEDLRICYASENIADFFPYTLSEIFEQHLSALFGAAGYHEIANIASHRSALQQREHALQYEYGGHTMEVSLYRSGAYVVLEIWPQSGEAFSRQRAADVRWVLNKVQCAASIQEILDLGVQSVQHITAFDQVMAYRFLADESGEVMAEAVAPELRTYKGLRFPTYSKQNCLLLTSRYVGKAKPYNYQHK